MNDMEKEKMMRIARQAMNIKVMELEFMRPDSDGKPISGSEYRMAVIYNLENISDKEVENRLHNGMYAYDTRILLTDPERLAHIFPHRGESKRTNSIGTYWKSRIGANDRKNCECSNCGFIVPLYEAIKFSEETKDYMDVRYRFCPNCGAIMLPKQNESEKE